MSSTDSSDVDIIQSYQNDAPSKVKLMIYHQFPAIELVSLYYSDGITCCLSPEQRIDADSVMQTDFNIDSGQKESICVLMYKLQRKSTNQPDEEATCIHLFMIWEVYRSGKFCVNSFLIEHDKSRVWNRDELIKLARYYKVFNIQYGPIEYTWLIYDTTLLMTRVDVIHKEECYKLEITISETSINGDTRRPLYIGLNR
jgi:hypothetical protein